MTKTYEQSIQRRVLDALFQAQVPNTMSGIAGVLQVNPHTVSGVLSILARIPELREVITIDKTAKPWTYYMSKGIPVDDMVELLRKQQKKLNIRKNLSKSVSREGRVSKLETGKETILIDKVSFPRGTSLRLTGDVIIAGIDVFLDVVAEVVKGRKELDDGK